MKVSRSFIVWKTYATDDPSRPRAHPSSASEHQARPGSRDLRGAPSRPDDYTLSAILPHSQSLYPMQGDDYSLSTVFTANPPSWNERPQVAAQAQSSMGDHAWGVAHPTYDDYSLSAVLQANAPPAHNDYSLSAVLSQPTPTEYGAPQMVQPEPSLPQPSARTYRPACFVRQALSDVQMEQFFSKQDRALLHIFGLAPGKHIKLSFLSSERGVTARTIQDNIHRINLTLKRTGASTIVAIPASGESEGRFVLESANPVPIKATEHYELMRNSFCSIDTLGQRHEIGLRDEEFVILEHLIDQGNQGATRHELDCKLVEKEFAKHDKRQVYVAIESLNVRLQGSTTGITYFRESHAGGKYCLCTQ